MRPSDCLCVLSCLDVCECAYMCINVNVNHYNNKPRDRQRTTNTTNKENTTRDNLGKGRKEFIPDNWEIAKPSQFDFLDSECSRIVPDVFWNNTNINIERNRGDRRMSKRDAVRPHCWIGSGILPQGIGTQTEEGERHVDFRTEENARRDELCTANGGRLLLIEASQPDGSEWMRRTHT